MIDDEMTLFKEIANALITIRDTYPYSRSAFEKPDDKLTPDGIAIRDAWREVNQAIDRAYRFVNGLPPFQS